MKILEIGCDKLSEKTVVTVGNFDGLHNGHCALLKEMTKLSQDKGIASAVVTFDPHTRAVLFPELAQSLLTTFSEKALLVDHLGIDYLLRIPFDKKYSEMSPDEFVGEVLVNRLNASDWVMGEGHNVGKDRSGGKKFLREAMSKYHITTFTSDLLTKDEHVVSSTAIRGYIYDGRISEAVEMLGHPYLISMERTSGLKIGSKIGYPTFNFIRPPSQKVIPPPGVYAAELEFDGTVQPGALYFGECPTFSHRDVHFEFHSLELNGREPEIGQTAHIWVYKFIRRDKIFSGPDTLADGIKNDINAIMNFFQGEKRTWR